jgi:hypothetical protein
VQCKVELVPRALSERPHKHLEKMQLCAHRYAAHELSLHRKSQQRE